MHIIPLCIDGCEWSSQTIYLASLQLNTEVGAFCSGHFDASGPAELGRVKVIMVKDGYLAMLKNNINQSGRKLSVGVTPDIETGEWTDTHSRNLSKYFDESKINTLAYLA